MSFTTALFWFFILIGVVIYYVLPSKVRWMWLLVLSYLYYFSFNVKNSLFMVAASLVIYLAALAMEFWSSCSFKIWWVYHRQYHSSS